MAVTVTSRGRGPVEVVLSPPVSFILAQTGRFRRNLVNMEPLWDRFKRTMELIEEERFASEGHGEWQPLAEATLRDRAAKGFPPGPIMVRTSILRDSLVNPALAASTSRLSMEWGTSVPYAEAHQYGIPGRLPQRTLLDIRVEDRRRLEADQVAWLDEVSSATFGRL